MSEQEEDFTSLSTVDKLQHKVWKARLSACEDLQKLFHQTVEDGDFSMYEPYLKKMVVEPNAVVQEAGLGAIFEYVSNAPHASSTRDTIVPALMEKCLGATKAGTKQKATDIILMYAEVDTPDPLLESVVPGINAKQPKLVTQTVIVLKELVRQFGTKKVGPKPIIKILPKLFGHADKNVRAEVFALTVELYRWIGQPMIASLSTLKPVQIKELEEAFAKLSADKPKPERLIRSEQVVEEEQMEEEVEGGNVAEEENDEMEVEETDAFDFADPVDITAKLPPNFYELLASKKWQERREALDALLEKAKTPKIMDKDYSELIGALAKRINDSNILLVGATAACIETIAQGLRTDFGKYKPLIAPAMTEKLKERKPAILEQLASGLNAVFASVPMSEMIEDVTMASKHKNPQVRSETFKLVARRLQEVREIPGKVEIKAFAEMFKKLLDDGDANAREAGIVGLATLIKLIGEKPMLPFTDGLDDIKMGKIKETTEKVTVKAKAPKKAVPPPPPVKKAPVKKMPPKLKSAAPPKSTPMEEDTLDAAPVASPPKRKPPARLAGASSMKKPALSSSVSKPKPATAVASAAPKKSAKLPPSSGPEEIKYKFAQEDAEARGTEFIPEHIYNDLKEAQWKLRLAAMESLYSHFESEDGASIEPEIVIRCFSKKPGWKEMNFQVMTKMLNTIQLLCERCPKFNKACAALCLSTMVEKLGDIKQKKPAGECLSAIAEKISLQFVFSQSYPVLKKVKSPKVLADALLWMHSCLIDFGISGLQVRDLIDLLKFALTNTNASVRTSAVTVLGCLRQYIGPAVKSFVEDVSPALMANIEAEFEKVSKLDPPQPTKGVAMDIDEEDVGSGAPDAAAAADAMESLFPRVDISGPLGKTVAACNDANWKIRKEGLDNVMAIIAGANNRIKPSLGAEFPGALKLRLNDSNKNLQVNATEITGLLAEAMGKPFDKYIKTFTGPIIAVLTDNKANVRAAGISALEKIRQACSMEMMAPALGTGLANETPTLRKELLTWFSTAVKEEPSAGQFDFSGMISPLFSCLQDRNADVRKAAQASLPSLISVVGYDAVMSKTTELKAAQRQTVVPFVEAARGNAAPMVTPGIKKPVRPEADTAASSSSPSRMKTLTRKKLGVPGTTSRISQVMAPPSSSTADEHMPPVFTSDPRAKQVRAKKEIRWQFDVPRPDVIEGLKSLFDANMSAEVTTLLFGNSQHAERDRLSGLTLLNECIASPDISMEKYNLDYSDMKQRYVANADLILKYLTIRFFDTNTSMLIKCLDVTQNLVAVLDEEGYHLSEYEAVSFLPFLINKVGDPKEVMRTRIRAILKALCRIYPASKVFNYLLDSAAASKNAKVRTECLEEVGALIQRNGISVMLPQKALPLIATHIGDRDAGVRNAALNAIAQAYILVGDGVWKYVTRLGEKEKGMLEERLKRTKPSASVLAAAEKERAKQEADEMEVDELPSISNLPRLGGRSQIGKPRTSVVHSQRSIHHVQQQHIPEPEPMEEVNDNYGHRIPEPAYHRPQANVRSQGFGFHSSAQPVPSPQQQQQQQMSEEDVADYLIAQITSGEPQPSIDALKSLDRYLTQSPQVVLPDIERLVNAITLQVRLAYSQVDPRQPATTRLCKHLVNALVLLFSNRDLAGAVPRNSLHHLLQELASRLLDQKMLSLESGPQLSKALNVAMVKVLENSAKNDTFSALLSILGTCSAGLRPGDSASAKDTKYTELIMKCLWKLAKTIQENLRTNMLSADQLLFEINKFFIDTPPSEWKRRANENVPLGEMPLRTVKTLLLELVNGLGENIFQHLTLINDPQRSSVYPYLHHMLEACRKKDRLQQQQQRSPRLATPPIQPPQQQPLEETNNSPRYTHSRNSSLGRPTSVSSLQSSNLVRSPSMGSYSAAEGDQHVESHSTNQSPRLSSATSVHVQPMQVDEPSPVPQETNGTLPDHELNKILTGIFHRIGSREQTKQGIIELYEFQKKYPLAEARVNMYLTETGSYFQSYIRRGLSNLAAEDNESHAASTIVSPSYATPIVTPAIPEYHQSFAPSNVPPSTHTMENLHSPRDPAPVPPPTQRQSFDAPHLRNDQKLSVSTDDTAEIKLRLLRLQQKFGYSNKSDVEDNGTASGPAGLSSENQFSRQETSPTYSTFSPRRQSGMNYDYQPQGESDRQQSVSALKERLAKMKQVINSASSPNL